MGGMDPMMEMVMMCGGMCNPMLMMMGGGMCNPMMMNMMSNGQGPYGKGCGKGSSSATKRTSKETMIWIEGLGDGSDANLSDELEQFFNEQLASGACTGVALRRGGTAVAFFDTEASKNQ